MLKRSQLLLLLLSVLWVATATAGTLRHHTKPINGRYMVTLSTDIPAAAYDGVVNSLAKTYNLAVVTEWRETPRGFICTGLSPSDAQRLVDDPRTRIVEE